MVLHERTKEVFTLPYGRHISGADRHKLFKDSFKFVFVRHPYLRLVSAYQNKVVDLEDYE